MMEPRWKPVPYAALPPGLTDELGAAGLEPERLYADVVAALEEDLPDRGVDVTSAATIPETAVDWADFGAREDGVVAGLAVAELVFRVVLEQVTVERPVAEGARVARGDVVLSVHGAVAGLLTAERTALNYACHLSGVATATARWVDALEGTRARVLDTRKTLPHLRALQKYAVRCGGGVNHRFSLSDMALVKDNHVLAAGGVVPAYTAVKKRYPDLPVEVEVTDLDQLRDLLAAGCERVLLDNMATETMREAVGIADGRATLEASGNLTLERAREVAETGVDFLSVGGLTHSVAVFDLGMDLRDEAAAYAAAREEGP
ncbi:MAG: carboxylating nicotinate-nucleotide diphosphorylase [Nocardioides sp.]|nr:carboxylating nicotinate-nucleotide diphosphorylase [Nocardioides sp.]